MLKAIKTMLAFAIFFVAAAMAGHEAHAQHKVEVPTIGKTDDGKYVVFDLKGDLTDITYFSGNTVYSSGDLLLSLPYADPKDVKSGAIDCEFICKNKKGQVVGQNPMNKKIPR